jgi:hypothetical protein
MAKSKEQQVAELKETLDKQGVNTNQILFSEDGASLDRKLELLQEAAKGTVSRDSLIEAAMKVFPELCPTKEAAAAFAGDQPVNSEYDAIAAAVLKEN